MGYTTEFEGTFQLDKPLTVKQWKELNDLAAQDHRDDKSKPGYYCQWVPTSDGEGIEWDGNEKFYDYKEWLEYIIKNYLTPWGLVLNGMVRWRGESFDDIGILTVKDNVVSAKKVFI